MKLQKSLMFITTVLLLSIVSTVAFAGTHSVISQKPYILIDGDTGTTYNTVKGNITMNWTDSTRNVFFNAVVYPLSPLFLKYEFVLVAIGESTKDEISGLWDIYKNGTLVSQGCVGRAYGLNASVGQYFKLYIGDKDCFDELWHLSGYVTNRVDY